MSRITALRVQAHNQQRVNVYLDGAFAFGIQLELATRLRRGQELEPGEIEALRTEDEAERAFERTLHYLSFRPRSEVEVRRYLSKRDLPEEAIEVVLDRLRRMRYVDDRQFAEFWVENRAEFRPKGRWALQAELRHKGVASEIIEDAVSSVDDEAVAMQAAQQRLRRFASLDEGTFRRRLLGFLQRRGFGYAIARHVVDRCWDQLRAQQDANPDKRASLPDHDID